MSAFPYGHATHPQWPTAAELVLAQIRARLQAQEDAELPRLALLYITDHFAPHARALLEYLSAQLPFVSDWAGTVGLGIASTNVEYFDEPALALMLCRLPADQYRVFSGVAPLPPGFRAEAALVHADGSTPELAELVRELAQRTASGYLFGGLASSRLAAPQFALAADGTLRGQGLSSGVFEGGLSGVAFGPQVGLVSRVTQGCLPLAGTHRISAAQGHVVTGLDGEPALDVMLGELQVSLQQPQQLLRTVRTTLVGLVAAPDGASRPAAGASDSAAIRRSGHFGQDVLVRHIVGLDPARRGIAVGDAVEPGMQLAFCRRDPQAARADLTRICAELRDEVESAGLAPGEGAAGARILGALYVSCTGRGGAHFGGASAELQTIRRALGDVPLVGFYAAGEIARDHLYAYTGVLTLFTAPA